MRRSPYSTLLGPVFATWLVGIAGAQPSLDTRHQLGLLSDILADTVTTRDGVFPVAAPHVRLVRDRRPLPAATGGDVGAVAALDCDGDGRDEVFIGHSRAYPGPSVLLRNDGTGRFTVVEDTGLPSYVGWIARGDLDNDGLCDLVAGGTEETIFDAPPSTSVTSRRSGAGHGPSMTLLACRATGGGRFTAEPVAGPPPGHPAEALWPRGGAALWMHVALADLDRDGRLDLFATEAYVDPGATDRLRERFWIFRGEPGRLVAVQTLSLPPRTDGDTDDGAMGSTAASVFDVDGDLWPDVTLLPRSGFFARHVPVLVFRNGGGRLNDRPDTLAIPPDPKAVEPCWFDADADGDYDLLAMQTDSQGGRHTLYLAEGPGIWRRAGAAAGLWSTYSLMCGAVWGDFDQDGLPDLVPCLNAQHVSPCPIPLRLNLGGARFGSTWAAFEPPLVAALPTALALDVDGDLDLDFLATPRSHYIDTARAEDFPAQLYRNESRGGRSVVLRLVGTRSNRSAIGARVEVATATGRQALEVGGGGTGGTLQPPLDLHVGLGDARATGAMTVRWPSGLVESWEALAAGRRHVLSEGSGTRAR